MQTPHHSHLQLQIYPGVRGGLHIADFAGSGQRGCRFAAAQFVGGRERHEGRSIWHK